MCVCVSLQAPSKPEHTVWQENEGEVQRRSTNTHEAWKEGSDIVKARKCLVEKIWGLNALLTTYFS